MSDKQGNPDRFVTVEAITDWMDEMVKRGDQIKVLDGSPNNSDRVAFRRSDIEKMIFEEAQEF